MRNLPYDFSVKYIVDSIKHLADCLTRPGPLEDQIKLSRVQVHEFSSRLEAKASRIELFCTAIVKDDGLYLLKHIL